MKPDHAALLSPTPIKYKIKSESSPLSALEGGLFRLQVFGDQTSWRTKRASHFGGSSLGFMLGSSRPFPAGLSSASFSLRISNVISTFPFSKAEQVKHMTSRFTNIFTSTQGVVPEQ